VNQPEFIITHTAAKRGLTTPQEIDAWHRDRGFRRLYPQRAYGLKHFGYHYYIHKDGSLLEGRGETEVGAHCRDMGMNRKSIGVCFEGHGDHEVWTPAQWRTFASLFRDLHARHGIPVANVIGHRETGARKTCPGKLVNMAMVRTRLDESAVPVLPAEAIGVPVGHGPLTFAPARPPVVPSPKPRFVYQHARLIREIGAVLLSFVPFVKPSSADRIMAKLIDQPSPSPTRKVKFGGFAGILTTVAIGALVHFGIADEAAASVLVSGVTTAIIFVVQYFTKERAK